MTIETTTDADGDTARNLALLNYGLLFAAIFFAGVPALIAVIIAYAQRDAAPPPIRSHHQFQIKIFWVAFAMSLLAGVCVLGAVGSALSQFVAFTRDAGWDGLGAIEIDLSRLTVDGRSVALGIAALVLGFLTTVWLIAAPAMGFIRLASARGIGHSARP